MLLLLEHKHLVELKIEPIPPEEFFLIERQAKSLKDAKFICHKVPTTRSELIEMGFDHDKGLQSTY